MLDSIQRLEFREAPEGQETYLAGDSPLVYNLFIRGLPIGVLPILPSHVQNFRCLGHMNNQTKLEF